MYIYRLYYTHTWFNWTVKWNTYTAIHLSSDEARDHIVMNEFTYDTFTHSVRLVSCVHMTKRKCKSTVPSMWFIHRHEMTQNVHNFSMCRANALSRMLYVNSVQLRIELMHAYPIEILSQTRRFSRKLQKNESYIISNVLYFSINETSIWIMRIYLKIFLLKIELYIISSGSHGRPNRVPLYFV